MIKKLLLLFVAGSFFACTPPVLRKENHFPVDQASMASVCQTITAQFPGFSCADYVGKTFKYKDSTESVLIKMKKTNLITIYKTAQENGELLTEYNALIAELKQE